MAAFAAGCFDGPSPLHQHQAVRVVPRRASALQASESDFGAAAGESSTSAASANTWARRLSRPPHGPPLISGLGIAAVGAVAGSRCRRRRPFWSAAAARRRHQCLLRRAESGSRTGDAAAHSDGSKAAAADGVSAAAAEARDAELKRLLGAVPSAASSEVKVQPEEVEVEVVPPESESAEPDESAAVPEEFVEDLEAKMLDMVDKQDFQGAAVVRDEISMAHLDDDAHVLSANTALYTAITTCDVKLMKALWLGVQCIHPYEKRCTGYKEVLDSWKRIFEVADFKHTKLNVEDVRVNVWGATATVVCIENVVSKTSGRLQRCMVASNTFRKVKGHWLVVLRHVGNMSEVGMLAEDGSEVLEIPTGRGLGVANLKILFQQGFHPLQMYDDHDGQVLGASGHDELRMSAHDEDSDDYDDDEDIFIRDEESEAARETVRELRRLVKEKRILKRDKFLLMDEMLKKPGESMPEKAYKLLLRGVTESGERQVAAQEFTKIMRREIRRIRARKDKAAALPDQQ
eukprot:CAMPEP_0170645302 /NCGR_PEP_ID=MMETSP0224-20130122/42997_1 /TAXON_ID=285029 /ORGANISM="Togula jolla, Strain CCCM 725" /LENGTH=516 /DNA_ID=CAMNT_0010976489 /DNA_START=85 /DNA_END=1635 /DNA_ORIENTATION=-